MTYLELGLKPSHIAKKEIYHWKAHLQTPQRRQKERKCWSFGIRYVVSPRGKSKGCLATFVERETRFYLAFKIPDRTATSMFSAIQQLCQLFPKAFLKIFTSDRGKAFACYSLVDSLGIEFKNLYSQERFSIFVSFPFIRR